MDKALITTIDDAADEIKGILTEGEFNARWTLLEAYYQVGKIIETLIGIHDMGVSELTASLAVKTGKSERNLYYALKMVRKYPTINKLPEGKAISWNKMVHKYLPESPKEEKEEDEKVLATCPICGFKFTKEDI